MILRSRSRPTNPHPHNGNEEENEPQDQEQTINNEVSSNVAFNRSPSPTTNCYNIIIHPCNIRRMFRVIVAFVLVGVFFIIIGPKHYYGQTIDIVLCSRMMQFKITTSLSSLLFEKNDCLYSKSAKSNNNYDCSSNGLFDGNFSCHLHRMRHTPVDEYYQEHRKIPKPKIIHATLPKPTRGNDSSSSSSSSSSTSSKKKKNILVIGDVHGCFHEMVELHQKAMTEINDDYPFEYVILTGDMTNKGPHSATVVQWVRNHTTMNNNNSNNDDRSSSTSSSSPSQWLSVRGNNDNTVLSASLGSTKQRSKKIHRWLIEAELIGIKSKMLSDDDVMFMAELPYSITIPQGYFEGYPNLNHRTDYNITIVHAGLLSHHDLESQELHTLVFIDNAYPICDGNGTIRKFSSHRPLPNNSDNSSSSNKNNQIEPRQTTTTTKCFDPVPWAKVWNGRGRRSNKNKQNVQHRHIIFGHDSGRGLQTYKWATGLDTGAVYQQKLTGLVLPEHKFVSIDTSGGCRP